MSTQSAPQKFRTPARTRAAAPGQKSGPSAIRISGLPVHDHVPFNLRHMRRTCGGAYFCKMADDRMSSIRREGFFRIETGETVIFR
jgi:hypothetical protein